MAIRSLENRAGGPVARSEEASAPLPVAVGTAEPGASMKTTFTIEIKDGRGQASTGRVLLPTGTQRAGRPPRCLPTAGDARLWPPSSTHRTCTVARAQGVSRGCAGNQGRHQPGQAIAPTPPDPDGRPSPPPELTLGLRAPPTLLSPSSGGKSTITHISSPGNLARLGSVTHVTSFSPASLGSRGGCSIKVSPSSSPHQPPHHPPHVDGFRVLGLTGPLPYCTRGKLRPRGGAHSPQPVGGRAKARPSPISH